MPKSNNKKIYIGTVLALVLVIVAGLIIFLSRSKTPEPYKNSSIAMGTVISQTIYSSDEAVAKQTITDIQKLLVTLEEKNLSWRIEGSDVNLINENESYAVSNTTLNCIKTCLDISKNCGGLFDITIGELTSLWGIGTEDAKVPTEDEIKQALAEADYTKISLANNKVSIAPGQKIDLGAVGKGLACDQIANHLKNTAVENAVISVGGSVLLFGNNPSNESGAWNIGIRDPFAKADDYAAILTYGPACVSTSGDYEKVLEKDGVKYHHILNPKTGYPAESNITGVTVVSKSGVISDGLSTACFILGYGDEALSLLKEFDSEAIFITKDKKIHITDGLKDKVKITNEDFSFAK